MFPPGVRLKATATAINFRKFLNPYIISFKQTFRIFCENTSLHGLKYIVGLSFHGNPTFQTVGKICWAIISLLGVIFTITMMELLWIRFQSTPTITTIETTTYPIWNVAFPAVTICNINKVDRSRAGSTIEALIRSGLSRPDANDVLTSMASLVNFESTNTSYENEAMLGKLGYSPAKLFLELNQPCESLIKYCYWLGSEVSCAKFFHTTKTHVGFCCSFNADKSMYVDSKPPVRSSLPPNIRLSGAGKNVGLSVMVDIAPEKYMAPTKSYFGAEVFIHSPRDFPADSDFEDTLQPGWDVDLCVTPVPIESSDSLRQVPLQQRKCFMPNEGTLQSYNRFSLNLCMSECRLRTIIKLCNCVPFFYADFNISEVEGVEICTLKK